MPACGTSAAAPGPRRARYLIPRELPRRADLIAGLVTAALLGQLPLALVLGAAEAAFLGWLDWLHTDAAAVRPARTGLIVAARRWYTRRAIRSGGVLTRDGSRLGVAADGRSAAVSWAEAEGGVLVAGRAAGPPGPGPPGPGP